MKFENRFSIEGLGLVMSEGLREDSDSSQDHRFTERETEVFRVLSEFDSSGTLAGLLEHLVEARERVDRPAGALMLGHAGRELSLGVLRRLAGRGSTRSKSAELAEESDTHKETIGRALHLPKEHPSVAAWYHAHNSLVAAAHYRGGGNPPDPRKVKEAADTLVSVLWSQLGSFVRASRELSRFFAIESPTARDINDLLIGISREAVRRDFFRGLEQRGWAAPLSDKGLFLHPPEVQTLADGSITWEAWPEGEYLRRIAADEPDVVRDAFLVIPVGLRNPLVWAAAAEASLELPIAHAIKLVPVFRKALESAIPIVFPGILSKLCIRLAKGGEESAFLLAGSLFAVKPSGLHPASFFEDKTPPRQKAGLAALSEYQFREVLPDVADALASVDAVRAFKFALGRLDAALEIEHGSPTSTDAWDASMVWCPDLTSNAASDELLPGLATAATGLAIRFAQEDEAQATAFLSILEKTKWQFASRMRLAVLAGSGTKFTAEAEAALTEEASLLAPIVAPEYKVLLRRRWAGLRPEAQRIIVDAVLAGPHPDTDSDELNPPSEEERRRVMHWQRRWLRRFGDAVPSELEGLQQSLLEELGPPTSDASLLQLEDTGWTGGVGWSSGPKSPLSEEQLAEMTAEEIADFARNFSEPRTNWDSPTPAGLADMLTKIASRNIQKGLELAAEFQQHGIQPTYARGLVEGFVAALREKQTIAIPETAKFITWVLAQDSAQPRVEFDYADSDWAWAQREAIRLLTLLANEDVGALTDADWFWDAAQSVVGKSDKWNSEGESSSAESLLNESLNNAAGYAAEAVVSIGLWHYRKLSAQGASAIEGGDQQLDYSPVVRRFRPLVQQLLSSGGDTVNLARMRLGRFLPQLLLLDKESVITNEEFFSGGPTEGMSPLWLGYILTNTFSVPVFDVLRANYSEAVAGLPILPLDAVLDTSGDRTWAPSRHLAAHALSAVLFGKSDYAEPDDWVSVVLSRAPVSDRAHAYWSIFSSWNEYSGEIHADFRRRLVQFWRFRLECTKYSSESERAAEAGALGWLAIVNALTDEDVLPLLLESAIIADGTFPMAHSMWKRLNALMRVNAPMVVRIVGLIVRSELRGPYPHFVYAEVAPILEAGLASGDIPTETEARTTIDRLCERGFVEFGNLL